MSSEIQEIGRDRWAAFFDGFTKQHAGRKIDVEAYGPGTNPHHEIRGLPFVGIVYEDRGQGSIEVLLGTEAENHVSHTVAAPIHVWARPEEAGDIVEIRADDGVTCLLRFAVGS